MDFNVFCLALFLYILTNVNSSATANKAEETTILRKPQKVLLVSIDGFRWDLNRITDTPNIDRVMENGVTVDHVLNVFPTKTLPNHQSIVTGLYPEHHGMIDNDFIDKELGATFALEDDRCMENTKFWQQALPIWIQIQRQTGYKTGNLFWPGYKVPYRRNFLFDNETSTYLPSKRLQQLYEKGIGDYNTTFYQLIDKAFEWLNKDDVVFVALYSMEPDLTLHDNGVEHGAVKKQVKQIDRYVGEIYGNITQDPVLRDQVNVIFIGDHGHVSTSSDRMLDLSKLVNNKEDIEAVFGFTNVFLYTKPNKTAQVYEQLKSAADKSTLFRVFLKENIPKYLHIRNNSRTGDILILPEPGWIVVDKSRLPGYLNPEWVRSEHGYDSMNRDMNPGFFAFGPMFKKGFKKFCIKTVDLYGLICKILDVEPNPNDGKFERVRPLLVNSKTNKKWEFVKDAIHDEKLPSLTLNDFSKRYKFNSRKNFSKRTELHNDDGKIQFEIKYDNGNNGRTNDNDDDDYDNDYYPIVCK